MYLLVSTLICFYRIIFRYLIKINHGAKSDKFINIVIYGAGGAGAQLLSSLKNQDSIEVIAFVDDNPKLWGLEIDNVRIFKPEYLKILKKEGIVDQIVLAIPSISNSSRLKIIENLKNFGISVYQVPSLLDLIKGEININQLNKINVVDLLGRDVVEPQFNLLKKNITDQSVLVTGAGGSIGQELCRQILKLKPSLLVIMDLSEVSLYNIDKELSELINKSQIELINVLGSCTNKELIDDLLAKKTINIIFHAAAYKHVPLVETNPVEALRNNVISTLNLCEASLKYQVDRFVLISSDKAVRPTNLMGASKRLSELIIKRYSSKSYSNKSSLKKFKSTIFSSVRFGNVLGSSGSVVPLFEKQIHKGGPVTLTHPEITRFFMTIQEASELVIQSSALAKSGDLFLLEMGKPVKILDLAKNMIRLNGKKVKESLSDIDAIEIIFTGLRKGEKLYEELLINDKAEKTSHPRIYREIEENFINEDFDLEIRNLSNALERFDQKESISILSKLVPEWKVADYLL